MLSGLKGLHKTINFLPSPSAGVIHTPREPTPTPHASRSHPLPVMLLCTHDPSLRRFKDSIRGGRQRVGAGTGQDGALVSSGAVT